MNSLGEKLNRLFYRSKSRRSSTKIGHLSRENIYCMCCRRTNFDKHDIFEETYYVLYTCCIPMYIHCGMCYEAEKRYERSANLIPKCWWCHSAEQILKIK